MKSDRADWHAAKGEVTNVLLEAKVPSDPVLGTDYLSLL